MKNHDLTEYGTKGSRDSEIASARIRYTLSKGFTEPFLVVTELQKGVLV